MYSKHQENLQCPILKKLLFSVKTQMLYSFYISFIHPRYGSVIECNKEMPLIYTELISFLNKNC